jgi:hypothetical protein
LKDRRKKNIAQSHKSDHKNIKPDIWKRVGYIPNRKLVNETHKEDYRARMNLPEGKGTHRSEGSNVALKKRAGL